MGVCQQEEMGEEVGETHTEPQKTPRTRRQASEDKKGEEVKLTRAQVDSLWEVVHSDTPLGFRLFYALLYGRQLPNHARVWIKKVYEARAKGKGTVIRAFRGSTKTTTLTNAFAAYRILQEPDKASLLIQVGDDIAKDNSNEVAKIIESSGVSKAFYPYVQPDFAKAWGSGGYAVYRTDMPYDDFQGLRMRWGKDPSFIGVGYGSGEVIGKHPSAFEIIDDINNERNTASQRRLAEVNKIVQVTIFPTLEPNFPWEIVVGTPWVHNDVLAYMESTGQYETVNTPVYEVVDEKIPGAVYYEPMGYWVKLTWPEFFPLDKIERIRHKVGPLGFAQMYLLDLAAAAGKNLKLEWLHEYPSDQIIDSWPVAIGVDYATVTDKLHTEDRDRCAIAVGRLIPGGGIVLVDGFVGHITRGDAELKVQAMAARYSPFVQVIGVDVLGKGDQFYDYLLHNTNLPVFPCKGGNKSKGERFENQLAPMFQLSRAWITDEFNSFVNEFKQEWAGWMAGAPYCDTVDAVYYMCQAGQGNLMPNLWDENLEFPGYGAAEEMSPVMGIGEMRNV